MKMKRLLFGSQPETNIPHEWQPWKWMWMRAFAYVYTYLESSSKTSLLGINSHLLCSELKAQFQENVTICSCRR